MNPGRHFSQPTMVERCNPRRRCQCSSDLVSGVYSRGMRNSIRISVLFLLLHGVQGMRLNLAQRFFDWFKSSEGVAKIHRQHVEGDTVHHMLKGTAFAAAPDSLKLDFAQGPAGAAVAKFMQLEQQYIGDWKAEKVLEAAGPDFDSEKARAVLQSYLTSAAVVVFSFVDCPWCLLAKQALHEELQSEGIDPATVRVIELEPLGRRGKELRAVISMATGRTSMPSIFVLGKAIGGYTDGRPTGDPDICMQDATGLRDLIESGQFRDMLRLALHT